MRSRPISLVGTILLLSLSAFSSTALAQSDWFPQNPVLKDLEDVTYAGADTWFAVGTYGSIYKSTDGGETWSALESGTTSTLYGVSFISVDTGVVVGEGGLILKTTNSGVTWEPKTSGTGHTLYDVMLTSANTGTAVGNGSTIIHTADGGETWYPSSNDPATTYSLPFYSLSFLDENFGIVVGGGHADGSPDPFSRQAVHLTTFDFGANWTYRSWDGVFYSIDLTNQDTMMTAGYKYHHSIYDSDYDYGCIFKSNVGGGSWIEYEFYYEPKAYERLDLILRDIAYLGEDSWVAVGDRAMIYHSTDDGIAWDKRSPVTTENLKAVDFATFDTGIVVGEGGIILKTTDSGITWEIKNSLEGTRDIYDIVFTDKLTAHAAGRDCRLRTNDGGTTWESLFTTNLENIYYNRAVAFANPDTGLVAGGRYYLYWDWQYGYHWYWAPIIYRTIDGGLTYSSCSGDFPYRETFNDVEFIDDTTAVALGNQDIYWSWDAGATWAQYGTGTAGGTGIAFANEFYGTFVRDDGSIYRTTDRGEHWYQQFETGVGELHDVTFVEGTHGWIVGEGGTILVTTDAGESWLTQSSDINATLRKVSFSDPEHGTVVGDGGAILRTTNGGDTWTPDESGTTEHLYGVWMTDAETGTVVGAHGTILRTEGEPVAVMLQQYGAIWRDDHAEVYWSVSGSSLEGELEHSVLRSTDGGDYFAAIPDADIERSGTDFILRDFGTEPGIEYIYHIDIYEDGRLAASFDASVETPAAALHLSQNHPNPFNPSTEIRFSTPEKGKVQLRIYDVSGRLVRVLVDKALPAGWHTASWDGRNSTGTSVASGIYFYQLRAGKLIESKKMVLLR
jgi:photosystem II stability/assembly factor-like uncharacterized protein